MSLELRIKVCAPLPAASYAGRYVC